MAKVHDNATDLITFARGSSATYTGSDGTQQTAATDEPRIEYAADGTLKGLLIEEQRTNLLLNSDNPDTQVATLPAGSHTLSFVGGPSVTGINDTITANAADVFVYDTSKDSDGGAWRHRTQHTSWYNEAASSTRGSRKEFPAVAVIVVEAAGPVVTIYDGDDPSLPMWMVANVRGQDTTNKGLTALGGQSGFLDSTAALNGKLCFGGSGTYATQGLLVWDFLADTFGNYTNASVYSGITAGTLADRNTVQLITQSLPLIVNTFVNDVAMTVLPDAPIDPATGLPVPTIAVATNGGVSVIKDDGTVVDITCADGGFTLSTLVDFRGSQIWMNQGNGSSVDGIFVFNTPPTADTALALNSKSGTGANADAYYKEHPTLGELHFVGNSSTDLNNAVSQGSVGSNDGLNHIAEDTTTPANGMVAYTTSDYATGWMNGDIKLAALADTTAETLSGTPYVDDDFSTYADTAALQAAWVPQGSTVTSLISGAMSITRSQEFCVRIPIGQVLPAGTVVTVEWEVISRSAASGYAYFGFDGAVDVTPKTAAYGAVGKHSATVKLSFARSNLNIYLGGVVTFTSALDNITIRLADPDRSVNGNGLAVHGSITKAAVATGADVVAYSGFNSSNYLEQPYNSDLDFGTGDFSVMGWVELNSTGYGGLVHRSAAKTSAGDAGFCVLYFPTGVGFKIGPQTCQTTTYRPMGLTHVCAKRDGTIGTLYVNGQLVATNTGMTNSATVSDATLLVGGYWQTGIPVVASSNDKFSLLRISATAPTADQIAKIYNDEKVLFQDLAKATLTGSSDAVTALAHDPDTDLLHVGTSGGRSVFYGLRRVNETATAVTTAISAVDGLIVEQ